MMPPFVRGCAPDFLGLEGCDWDETARRFHGGWNVTEVQAKELKEACVRRVPKVLVIRGSSLGVRFLISKESERITDNEHPSGGSKSDGTEIKFVSFGFWYVLQL
jgi:hypothetical protein